MKDTVTMYIRVSRVLHNKIYEESVIKGRTMNQVIQDILEAHEYKSANRKFVSR